MGDKKGSLKLPQLSAIQNKEGKWKWKETVAYVLYQVHKKIPSKIGDILWKSQSKLNAKIQAKGAMY